MTYYDRIAKNWHTATGYRGGSFKKHVLNSLLLQKMASPTGQTILELGAGNGYFMRLALQHYTGQIPRRVVISDNSVKLLAIAESNLPVDGAEYLVLDVRSHYPFTDESFDLILATMVFNELTAGGMRRALGQCHRVLQPKGLLLVTVTHPDFIASLQQRDLLEKNKEGLLTMPGSGQLRLPIVPRSVQDYRRLLVKTGYSWQETAVYATDKVINEKPGLRHILYKPLALIFECRKQQVGTNSVGGASAPFRDPK